MAKPLESLEEIQTVAVHAALAAGRLISDLRAKNTVTTSFKGDVNLVTTADLAAEQLISDHIKGAFPTHNVLSEEFAPKLGTDRDYLYGSLWIVDPIDGTTNYAHGHNMVGVSVAYAYNGEIQCAAINAPFINETYTAMRGRGAFLNGKPIAPRDPATLKECLVATGFPYRRDTLGTITERLTLVLETCRDIRRLGAACLDICWVAAGKLDAYYEDVELWDIAAASLIAREAGATVGHIVPPPSDSLLPVEFYVKGILVTGPRCFRQFQRLLDIE